jgi:hypothetical protein
MSKIGATAAERGMNRQVKAFFNDPTLRTNETQSPVLYRCSI